MAIKFLNTTAVETNLLYVNAANSKVGIGTASPSTELQVSGTVRADVFGVQDDSTNPSSNTSTRVTSPAGATYDDQNNTASTGVLSVILPSTAASTMLSFTIRVFDYANNESFDVNIAGYWYGSGLWTNTSVRIESQGNVERNFNVRFGKNSTTNKGWVGIGETTSAWSYVKFAVLNFQSAHVNDDLERWNDLWDTAVLTSLTGYTTLITRNNSQVNNWARNGEDLYYGSGSGNVGIGTANPISKIHTHQPGTTGPSSGSIPSNNGVTISGNDAILMLRSVDDNTTVATSVGMGRYNAIGGGLIDQWGINTWYDTGAAGSNLSDRLAITYGTSNAPWGNSEKVSIKRNGNVGIGTTSPAYPLDVSGEIRSSNRLWLSTVDALSLAGTVLRLGYSNSDIQLRAGSGTRMTIKSSGSVGIGTTSPTAKLEVDNEGLGEFTGANSSTAGSSHLMLRDEGGTARTLMSGPSVVFQTPANADGTNIWATSRLLGSPAAAGSARGTFSIQVRDQYDPFSNGTSWNWRTCLTAINTGNVGIGTTSPGATLDVASASPTIRITNTNATLGNGTVGSFEFFTKDSSTGGTRTVSSIICDNQAGSAVPGGELVFKTSLGGGGLPVATEKMRITSAGKVGINTVSPTGILNVEGNATGDNTPQITISSGGVDNNAILQFDDDEGGQICAVGALEGNILTCASTGDFLIKTNSGSITGTTNTRLYINQSGNVGIGTGTATPGGRLHVKGGDIQTTDTTGSNGVLRIRSTLTGTPTFGYPNVGAGDAVIEGGGTTQRQPGVITLINDDSSIAANQDLGVIQFVGKDDNASGYTSSQIIGTSSGAPSTGNSGGGILRFLTSSGGTGVGVTEKMRIDKSGKVGIGVVPTATLDVSGSFKLQSGGSTYLSIASYYGSPFINTGTSGGTVQFGAPASNITNIQVQGTITAVRAVRMGNESAAASASNAGSTRYRVSGNNSYMDMSMRTGATSYAWVNIVQNNW